MSSSWKIGAISGLIAGIAYFIVSEIFVGIRLSFDLVEPWARGFLENNTLVNIPLFFFWCVVLGIVYSRVHSLIPGKDILKGLIYGLFLFVIVSVSLESYLIPYGYSMLNVIGNLLWGFFIWIAYGLSLGVLYKLLHDRYLPDKEEPKIVTYPMNSGLLPGAIAGLMQGITAGVISVIGHVTGLWGVPTGGEIVSTISFWAAQFGTHMIINMLWGTFFGAFFALVYNIVPGKKVGKALYYAFIIYFISIVQFSTWYVVWYANHSIWQISNAMVLNIIVYAFDVLTYGLVLGYLYKKPGD